MTTNMKMIERLPLEVLNKGSVELINEILSVDYVDHAAQPGTPKTRDGFKQTVLALRTAFPGPSTTRSMTTTESGDRIVHRLTASGTMKGDFQGMTASGKRATWTEIHIGRVANGRLIEHWSVIDQLGMLVQLGFVPAPRTSPCHGLVVTADETRGPDGNVGAFRCVRALTTGGQRRAALRRADVELRGGQEATASSVVGHQAVGQYCSVRLIQAPTSTVESSKAQSSSRLTSAWYIASAASPTAVLRPSSADLGSQVTRRIGRVERETEGLICGGAPFDSQSTTAACWRRSVRMCSSESRSICE